MSKQRKSSNITTRLRLTRQDLSLPKLFDMIALIAFLGGILFAGISWGISNSMEHLPVLSPDYLIWRMWIRSTFSLMMYCSVTCGLSYAIGRLMANDEFDQVKHFKNWFAAELVLVILIVLGLGLFY
jgi:hypothetical protein